MFSSRLWNLFIDSFPKMFIRGLTVTIPLTAIAFSLAMVIAVIVALVQFANIKVLKQICRFYIWSCTWAISGSSNCICLKWRCLWRRDSSCVTWIGSVRSVRGRTVCRSFISTNDFQNRFATGDAYGVSVPVQCIDFHVKGYFIGSDYYRNGNV